MNAAKRPLSQHRVKGVGAVSLRLCCVAALLPRRGGALVAVGASQAGGGIGIGGGTDAVTVLVGHEQEGGSFGRRQVTGFRSSH